MEVQQSTQPPPSEPNSTQTHHATSPLPPPNLPQNQTHLETGMIFETIDELYDTYQKFAHSRGFEIVKSSRSKGKDGLPQFVTFGCHKARDWSGRGVNGVNPVCTKRTGCTARVAASRGVNGQWKINKFLDDHNHELDPGMIRYITRRNRVVSPYGNYVFGMNDLDEIRSGRIKHVVVESDRVERVECGLNECGERVRRWRLRRGDVDALIDMFVRLRRVDLDFFYGVDVDDDGRMRSVVWVDGRSRAAYREFHDVVSFDTTCLINKYDVPLALFIGVNHHRQLVLLGCAIVFDEEVETYSWVFNTWLKCMDGKAPDVIITDHCESIRMVIKEVLPNSRHRWCLWHILSKFPEKMKQKARYAEMQDMFKEILYESVTHDEFDQKWLEFVTEFDIAENEWLLSLIKEKEMWVPAYIGDFFLAGIQSTQRCENMHSYFSGYVHRGSTLKQFIKQYGIAIMEKIEKEKKADYETATIKVSLSSNFKWEKQVQTVYTKEMYSIFREEVVSLMYCFITEQNEFDGALHHRVVEKKFKKDGTCVSQYFDVQFDVNKCKVSCLCHHFERVGILCRHALSVLIRNEVQELPDDYILCRWRKDVNRPYSCISVNYTSDILESSKQQCEVEKVFYDTLHVALKNEGSLSELKKILSEFANKVVVGENVRNGVGGIIDINHQCVASNDQANNGLEDPLSGPRKRGRPRK